MVARGGNGNGDPCPPKEALSTTLGMVSNLHHAERRGFLSRNV